MPYFEVADFKAGVDVRRSRYTSVPGTLQKLVNAHITRGGDVERRKAFVPSGTFGANTFGLEADVDGLVTFGSAEDPGGLPDGVRYQRLQAPSGADMVSIDAIEQFGGKLYVAATFSDGVQWHFYDGEVVGDWGGGIARAYMSDNAGIAESLRTLINDGGIYTATRSGSTLTITGPEGVDFDAVGATENRDGGNPNQGVVIGQIQDPVVAVDEITGEGALTVIAGRQGPGNEISRVTVRNGSTTIQLLQSAVPFETNARVTAVKIASAINNGSHGFIARAQIGAVLLQPPPGTGDAMNGAVVEAEVTGSVCLADGKFSISGGADNRPEGLAVGAVTITAGKQGSGNTISRITVYPGGSALQLLPAAVPFTSNTRATATAVAAAINAGSHGYTAESNGGAVIITAPVGSGASANGVAIEAEAEGEVCLADGKFAVTGGADSNSDKLIMVKVGGLQVVSNEIPWDVSNEATAAAIASDINSYASSPKFVAVSIGETVYLAPKVVRSTDPSVTTIQVTTDGDFGAGGGAIPPEGPPGGGGGGGLDPREPKDPEIPEQVQ